MSDDLQSLQNMKIKYELGFEVETETEAKSIKELRKYFFKYHTEIVKGKPKGVNPNAFVLNPELYIPASSSDDIYYVVYCRGYYVTIERNPQDIKGPHAAKLQLQVYAMKGNHEGKIVWLGTAQFDGNFFNEENIKIQLKRAIRLKEYFVSEKTAEIVIEITEPNDTHIEIT